jgi:hypothetical protein
VALLTMVASAVFAGPTLSPALRRSTPDVLHPAKYRRHKIITVDYSMVSIPRLFPILGPIDPAVCRVPLCGKR